MKFNSQIATNRPQSERLLALGLKKETADMGLTLIGENEWIPFMKGDYIHEDDIPAWSLHRLWELASIKHIILDSKEEIATLYNEIITKIEQFIEEGSFNEEYLVNQAEVEEHCKGVLEYLDYIRGEEEYYENVDSKRPRHKKH